MKEFFENVWVKRSMSIFCLIYVVFIGFLTYATFLYELVFAKGMEPAFFTIYTIWIGMMNCLDYWGFRAVFCLRFVILPVFTLRLILRFAALAFLLLRLLVTSRQRFLVRDVLIRETQRILTVLAALCL